MYTSGDAHLGGDHRVVLDTVFAESNSRMSAVLRGHDEQRIVLGRNSAAYWLVRSRVIVTRAATATHLLLAGLFTWMSALVAIDDLAQAQSGYLPPVYGLSVLTAVALVIFGLALATGSIALVRTGNGRPLLTADAFVIVSSWTFLMVLFLLPCNTLLAVLLLEPLALGLLLASDRHNDELRGTPRDG